MLLWNPLSLCPKESCSFPLLSGCLHLHFLCHHLARLFLLPRLLHLSSCILHPSTHLSLCFHPCQARNCICMTPLQPFRTAQQASLFHSYKTNKPLAFHRSFQTLPGNGHQKHNTASVFPCLSNQ